MTENSGLETYGFGSDDRFDEEVVKDFQSEYSKILQRRLNRWKSLNIDHLKRGRKEKRFIRKGIPSSMRAQVWLKISGVEERMKNEPKRYSNLLQKGIPQSVVNTIITDVPRTFPENANFRTDQGSTNLNDSLANVLKAMAAAETDIGYCQGMNFVAAFLLLVVRDEEKAFWLLEHLLTIVASKDYYTPSMTGLKRDCDVLADLVRKKMPNVADRLTEMEVSYVVICTKWFICMFLDTLPLETCLRIMDCLFLEGDKVLFRVALTLFKLNDAELSRCDNFPKMVMKMQSMVYDKQTLYCHEFMENVFKKPGALSRKNIDKLRSTYSGEDKDSTMKSLK